MMKQILNNLALDFSNPQDATQNLEVITINNPDGSIRWMIPANANKANFLKFYSATTLKAKTYAFAMKTIFRFKLQTILFGKTIIHIQNKDSNPPKVDLNGNDWALFSGTKGPNNKIIYYHETSETFTKIATTKQSQKLINYEMKTLQQIEKLNLKTIEVPTIKTSDSNTITMSDISTDGTRSQKFSTIHQNALSELYNNSVIQSEKFRIPVLRTTHLVLNKLDKLQDDRIPSNMLVKLRRMINELDESKISVVIAHGDFTPWNTLTKKNKLAVYDWELSKQLMPVGFDAFHFIIQDAILVKRKKWSEIKKEILAIDSEVFKDWTKDENANVLDYLKLYLLINVSNYLKVYALQEEWHTQVSWLIETWNEAITDLITTKEESRAALITNFYDFIQNKKYAVIKAKNEAPELLSEYSDLDITIEKKDLQSIISFFENHSLTKHILVSKKSFMSTVQVVLENGAILSLDLIWQFKVKSVEFLSANDVLIDFKKNDFGVKTMSNYHTSIYLACFYGLNNSKVPQKFLNFANDLFVSPPPHFSTYFSMFLSRERQHSKLVEVVKQFTQNRGLKGLSNKFNYVLDTCRNVMFNNGMVMSFSGVDGAGKSTIIEKTKEKLEKQLRRKVVVLRHRPSMLPILSTWTKGKEQAQKDVIASLPRQGKNNSFISSILRFSYYFADYFFGQFYVLFKHVLRGEVVLYDRFYFDFINDSKRSNIVLPKILTKLAYKFILSPDLNFFLYADSETILKRKKELDASTITSLNKEYIELFNDFNEKKKDSFYTIKNLVLEDTLDTIMFQTIKKVA